MNNSDRRNNIFACAVVMVIAKRDNDMDLMVKCGKAMDKLVTDSDIEYAQGWADSTPGMEGMAKMLGKKCGAVAGEKAGKGDSNKPLKKAPLKDLMKIVDANKDKLTREQQIYVIAVSMANEMKGLNIGTVITQAGKLAGLVTADDWQKVRELLGVSDYEPLDEDSVVEEAGEPEDLKERGDADSFSM